MYGSVLPHGAKPDLINAQATITIEHVCQPRSCTDTHPYLRGTTESNCIYLFLNVLGYCIATNNDFKNTYNIPASYVLYKGTCTVHTTIAKKPGNPGDLMTAGEKSGSTFHHNQLSAPRPSTLFLGRKYRDGDILHAACTRIVDQEKLA